MDQCPHCQASLVGEPIPEDILHLFNPLDWDPTAPPPTTHFRKEVGINHPGTYDGALYYACWKCGGAWNRWSPDDRLWSTAEQWVKDNNAKQLQDS